MLLAQYFRRGSQILDADQNLVKQHNSINAAKKHSRELQTKALIGPDTPWMGNSKCLGLGTVRVLAIKS